jgi:GTP-binding protein YchF
MKLAAGIIGLPNVGKSTIFNALCCGKAAAENYPFCTIEPNHGIIAIPDPRLGQIFSHITTDKVVPAFLELVDIAGLVKGASKGEGLGNQFLGHIKDVDAIVHVVRCFEDDNVVHVDGSPDPLRDISIIETELLIKDLETVEKNLSRVAKAAKTGDKECASKVEIYQKLFNALSAGTPARKLEIQEEDRAVFDDLHLITAKPVLYVANIGESLSNDLENNHIARLKEYSVKENTECIVLSGKLESEIAELPEDERKEFLVSSGITQSGLENLARSIYQLLGLCTFFTVNEKELHAWTIKKGWTAPEAAGEVHSDFKNGFVKADIYTVNDLENYKSESALRAAGKIRSEGKDYVVQDGDILFFKASPQ